MVSTPSPPPAPDPVATANAQAAMNKNTAIAQTGLNSINQITPEGTLTYRQIGKWPDGTPRFEATTALSPAAQAIFNLTNQTKTNLGQIGVDQSSRIGALLGTNVDLNTATEGKIDALGRARLDPQFAQQEDAMRTRLSNQGIQPGSAAWDAEMQRFQQGRNDAYNQLYLTGRGQAAQEALTERNQPINEISALLSGSQVSQPNFVGTPQTQIGGVDYTGLVSNLYGQQMQGYNSQLSQGNAAMGGLFGLGGTLGSAAMKFLPFSDRRLKTDIQRVGKLDNGLPWYKFKYVWDGAETPIRYGLMSDDVRKICPEAVITQPNGYDAVDYTQAMEA